jgi:hypothetical protein
MSNLRVPARVDPDQDIILSATLDKYHNSICYAPSSKPKFINAILDAQVGEPGPAGTRQPSTLPLGCARPAILC